MEPNTLSDSSSPIALHFGQNVAFHYASVFTYTHTHTHTHTHIQLRGKRWSHKHRWFKHVHLRKFDTNRFKILTQRCILIRTSVHVRVKSISGWEAVEPQTISETSSPIGFKFWHAVAFESARVCIYGMGRDGMGWDGTGRDGVLCDGTRCDGMRRGRGRNGTGREGMWWDGLGWDGTERDGTQPQQRVAGHSLSAMI
jgi:hypothetical protein